MTRTTASVGSATIGSGTLSILTSPAAYITVARIGTSTVARAFSARNLRSHNPEVAGSNPAPATGKDPQSRAFSFSDRDGRVRTLPECWLEKDCRLRA